MRLPGPAAPAEPVACPDGILILGVGNDLLGDDAAGLLAADALAADGLPVSTSVRSGLALLDAVVGVRRVLLIDSQTSGRSAGAVSEFVLEPSPPRSPSAHYLGYGEALALGAALGLDLPDEIRVLAVERTPEVWVGAGLSDPVRAALPEIIARARAIVRVWSEQEAPAKAAAMVRL